MRTPPIIYYSEYYYYYFMSCWHNSRKRTGGIDVYLVISRVFLVILSTIVRNGRNNKPQMGYQL